MPPVSGYEYKDSFDTSREPEAEDYTLDLPGDNPEGLLPPESVSIVEQVYRKDAAGRTVVDLIVEVEDVPGATEYEIRTSVA